MSAKPVHLSCNPLYTMDWTKSISRCEQLRLKDKEHGHKIEAKQGDEVMTPDGRVGVLTHKEFLRECPEVGHDIWNLVVQYNAECRTFTNPSAIRLHCARERRQVTVRPDASQW